MRQASNGVVKAVQQVSCGTCREGPGMAGNLSRIGQRSAEGAQGSNGGCMV